jgi:hypothetical protein
MKTQLTRITVIAALSVSAFTSIVPFANAAHADSGDYSLWRSNYGTNTAADGDGDVDGRDFLVWQHNPAADGDGDVDGRDFLVWQRGSSPAAGDGDVDGRDFLVWQRGSSPTPFDPGFVGGVNVAAADIN